MINLITRLLVKLIHRVRAREVPLQDPNYLSAEIWNKIKYGGTTKAARRETSARARSACVCAAKMSLAAASLIRVPLYE